MADGLHRRCVHFCVIYLFIYFDWAAQRGGGNEKKKKDKLAKKSRLCDVLAANTIPPGYNLVGSIDVDLGSPNFPACDDGSIGLYGILVSDSDGMAIESCGGFDDPCPVREKQQAHMYESEQTVQRLTLIVLACLTGKFTISSTSISSAFYSGNSYFRSSLCWIPVSVRGAPKHFFSPSFLCVCVFGFRLVLGTGEP